jgi:membrane protease YdiL (CAAX protease family)
MRVTFKIVFLLLVGVVLPALAWSSLRWLRTTSAATEPTALPSARALGWQTVVLQTLVAGVAGLAAWGGGLRINWLSRVTAAGVLTSLAILLVALAVAWLEGRRPLGSGNQLRRTLRSVGAADPVWLLATTIAAVSEELAYRGVLTDFLSGPLGLAAGAIVSAIVFGASHFAQGWRGAAFSAVFGLGLQVVVAISGGLLLAIVTHLTYDLCAAALGRRMATREPGL